jgi:hypothetical protein
VAFAFALAREAAGALEMEPGGEVAEKETELEVPRGDGSNVRTRLGS